MIYENAKVGGILHHVNAKLFDGCQFYIPERLGLKSASPTISEAAMANIEINDELKERGE